MMWILLSFVLGLSIGYRVGVHLRLAERVDRLLQKRLQRADKTQQTWGAFEQAGHREQFERAMLNRRKY